jgi:hypothetical protein
MNLPFDFNWRIYLELNPDLNAAGITTRTGAIKHWFYHGHSEHRMYRFDWRAYLELNPDLGKAGIRTQENAIRHWINYGKQENRQNSYINIVTLSNIECSIAENAILLKKYLLSIGKKNIKIIDIKAIESLYNSINNIICIQPFELNIDILEKFVYKPKALWLWEFKSLSPIYKKYEKYFSKILTLSNFCVDIFSENLSIPIEKINIRSQIHNYIEKIKLHTITNQMINDVLKKTKNKKRYGYCFCPYSSMIRKNVFNLIKAFNLYKKTDKVLILKTRSHRGKPKEFSEMYEIIRKSNNIYLIDDHINILDLYKLYTFFDYYISSLWGGIWVNDI